MLEVRNTSRYIIIIKMKLTHNNRNILCSGGKGRLRSLDDPLYKRKGG